MNLDEWKAVALKVEKIFNSDSAKLEMGLKKQGYMLTVLSATKSLYKHIQKPMNLNESYYIGNITMRHHSKLIEAIEELEEFIKNGNENEIKNYGFIVRSFKVMICNEGFNQDLDSILSDFSNDVLEICRNFESSI